MRSSWVLCCCASLLGCLGEPDEGRKLGDDLGTFDVAGIQQSSNCGKGALGSESKMKFDIELSRESNEIFWDKRAAGSVGKDGKFSVTVPVTFPITDPKPPSPGCTMHRLDTVQGKLLFEDDAPEDVLGFTGTMKFDFAPGEGQSCSELIGVEGGFKNLPCSVSYSLDGIRTRDPE